MSLRAGDRGNSTTSELYPPPPRCISFLAETVSPGLGHTCTGRSTGQGPCLKDPEATQREGCDRQSRDLGSERV